MKVRSRDGVEVAYETVGHGKPLVLLHGFASTRQCWRDLGYTEVFARAGFRLILIDARGHGESDKPHNVGAYAQIERASDVVAVLDGLGLERADIFGFSMGGWIGIGASLAYPSRVARLVTCSAHGFAQSMGCFRSALQNDLNGWVNVMESLIHRPATDKLRTQILSNDITALRQSVADDRKDVSRDFALTKVRFLSIGGTHDPQFEQISRFADVSRGKLLAVAGRNHVTSIMAVRTVASAVLSFLDTTDVLPIARLQQHSYQTDDIDF